MAKSGKILITGAAGFVGTALCRYLLGQGYELRVLLRRGGSRLPADLAAKIDDVVEFDDAADDSFWAALLTGVDRVVHLAARAHIGGQKSSADLYFRDNLDLTVVLAQAALGCGVKRFVFLSSIKVNGDGVLKSDHRPYRATDRPRPQGVYAVSKWRAEQKLRSLFVGFGAPELVIIRPPLVYGAKAKGNYALLQKWLGWGLPLPIPRAGNRRSLLALDRLVEIIAGLLPETAVISKKLLLPCDRRDWSARRLANYLAAQTGGRARTLAVPEFCFCLLAVLFRQEELFTKLFGSLRIEAVEMFEESDRK